MNTINQIVRYAIAILLMIPMLAIAIIIAPFSRNLGWRMVRSWKKTALAIFGVKVELEFEGNPSQLDNGGILVGLTQQSLLDPTAAYSIWDRPLMSIWNIEYALIPFFGWVSFILGWVIVRQNPKQSKRQLNKAAEYARNGGLVYLSAEGQRSMNGELNPYKKGPIVLAIQSQVIIHPIYVSGSRHCLPPREWKIRPGVITIRLLRPVQTEGLTYEDRNTLLAKIRSIGESEHDYWTQKSKKKLNKTAR